MPPPLFEIAERLGDAFSRSWARYWDSFGTLVAGRRREALVGFGRALTEIHEQGAGRESEPLILAGSGAALVAFGRSRPRHRGLPPGR